jgi:hypothetical protein
MDNDDDDNNDDDELVPHFFCGSSEAFLVRMVLFGVDMLDLDIDSLGFSR